MTENEEVLYRQLKRLRYNYRGFINEIDDQGMTRTSRSEHKFLDEVTHLQDEILREMGILPQSPELSVPPSNGTE